MKEERTYYVLKLGNSYLAESHNSDFYGFAETCDRDEAYRFDNVTNAIDALCNDFNFYGISLSAELRTDVKARLEKTVIEEIHVVEEISQIDISNTYLPTNREIADWYLQSRNDPGLDVYLKQKEYKEDGYDFISGRYRDWKQSH